MAVGKPGIEQGWFVDIPAIEGKHQAVIATKRQLIQAIACCGRMARLPEEIAHNDETWRQTCGQIGDKPPYDRTSCWFAIEIAAGSAASTVGRKFGG